MNPVTEFVYALHGAGKALCIEMVTRWHSHRVHRHRTLLRRHETSIQRLAMRAKEML